MTTRALRRPSWWTCLPACAAMPMRPESVFSGFPVDFVVTKGTISAGAAFIFAGESGTISGWSPAVDGTHAITMYDDPNRAVFKGLAIANNGTENLLYATDFHNNEVVVFDRTFASIDVPGGFKDATLPEGYAPFGIQALQIEDETRIVVTYAKQDLVAANEVVGGWVRARQRIRRRWHAGEPSGPGRRRVECALGLALAPENFGTLSDKLLVGIFGSGVIAAYDPVSGELFGSVNDATGSPIATPGLWGIAFGNGGAQPTEVDAVFLRGHQSGGGRSFRANRPGHHCAGHRRADRAHYCTRSGDGVWRRAHFCKCSRQRRSHTGRVFRGDSFYRHRDERG